jgi:hypothetical protein
MTVKLLIRNKIEIFNFCERKSSLQLCGGNSSETEVELIITGSKPVGLELAMDTKLV